jgi:acyl carrier protein
MNDWTRARIYDDLGVLFRDFHGRQYYGDLGPDTRFFADLGLASIDAVVLGESLESRYGCKLPFGELMGELGKRTDRDLRMGELVDFLQVHLQDAAG